MPVFRIPLPPGTVLTRAERVYLSKVARDAAIAKIEEIKARPPVVNAAEPEIAAGA
ncbi:hypothetical protein [Nakamurella antarctica]|uniref:hypothetical protein n=1 Tax=Nakamurella antarctica TaxID=1902245 RepID=UPI0013DE6640|nr:hypothetical protein [Nakamurella antarctica]